MKAIKRHKLPATRQITAVDAMDKMITPVNTAVSLYMKSARDPKNSHHKNDLTI